MTVLITKISLSLILSTLAIAAVANPGQGRGERDAARVARQSAETAERGGAQAVRNFQYPGTDASSDDSHRKHNKLSPEERRALRRQINEAGQDLYIRKP